MKEVKIREITENIRIPGPMGIESFQPYSYLQLYFPESGETVPDNIYTLKQSERELMINITNGQARGIEWVDHTQAMFLI